MISLTIELDKTIKKTQSQKRNNLREDSKTIAKLSPQKYHSPMLPIQNLASHILSTPQSPKHKMKDSWAKSNIYKTQKAQKSTNAQKHSAKNSANKNS